MRTNPDCLFCKIATGELPAKIRYQDEQVVAFDDINPKAPVHILVVPRDHIATVDDIEQKDEKIVGAMIYSAQKIAREVGVATDGYRLIFNVKEHGGQVVDHIHLHIMGGRKLGEMA